MQAWIALSVFLAAYALFVVLPRHRSWVAGGGALALMLGGVVSPQLAFLGSAGQESLISWKVMGIFVGTLLLADLFIWSRVPHYIAERLVNRSRNACWAMVKVCLFSGVVSIAVENVAVVLIVAPIAFALAEKLKVNPAPLIIGVTISSNLQGTATLIGDPASLIFARFANFSFNDFFFYEGKPSIFFAIQLGALTSLPALYWAFRKLNQRVEFVAEEKILSWVPGLLLLAMILALAGASLAGADVWLGIICMAAGIAGIAWYGLLGKSNRERFPDTPWRIVRRLDWDSAVFLMGVFVLVGGLVEMGWIEALKDWLIAALGNDFTLAFVAMIIVSMAVSAFVDNIPYLAAMVPVTLGLGAAIGHSEALSFALLIGGSLGGNITPIGASANIVGIGQLRQRGRLVGFIEFARIGLPFTVAATVPAALFIYLLWAIF
ncbi:MAG TPA: SLC13 family permease [Candidatus Bipolaricaulota bacterium]